METQGPEEAQDTPDPKLADALSDRMSILFQEADTDGNGTLSRTEFQEVPHICGWHVYYVGTATQPITC